MPTSMVSKLHQGDLLETNGLISFDIAHTFVAIVSQTCDIVQANKPNISISPAVQLDAHLIKGAIKGQQPRYVPLPAFSERFFVDLDFIRSISKSEVPYVRVLRGLEAGNDTQVRSFSLAVGRRFSRFAFPDEVVPWLQPLKRVLIDKANRGRSPMGLILDNVVELRIEADNWSSPGRSLTIHVIVKAGSIPELDGEATPSPTVLEWSDSSGRNRRSPAEIAAKMIELQTLGTKAPLVDLEFLWHQLGEAFVDLCIAGVTRLDVSPQVTEAVASISCNIASEDEFPISKVRKSESLDLDHLSPPLPEGV